MEVQFTPEVQTKLALCAARQGRRADEVVRDVLARYLEDEGEFLAAVERGLSAADRGDLIEEADMDARVEAMFRP